MTQLAKSIIHNQTYKLAKRYYPQLLSSNDEGRRRALSKTYALLSVMLLTDVDEEVAADAVVDGGNDMGIDAILVDEPQSEFFNVHIFQSKYSEDLDKDKGFPENDVIKIIDTLQKILRLDQFEIRDELARQLALVRAHLDDFNIPNFYVYLCNNGQEYSVNAKARIEDFLGASPENAKRYQFRYVNHQDLFNAFQKAEPVNCALEFAGGFIDEAIHYKRAFVGKVPVTIIADMIKEHGDRLLQRNVRDFLGFKKIVNEGIRATLLDESKRPDFYFLNNGITLVCEKLDYAQGVNGVRARLSNAQIINGGQTSRTIEQVINENPGLDFSNVFVLVRAYQVDVTDQGDLIHDITIATNSQNAIFARDLHANDPVQKKLEAGLQHYGVRYLRRRDARRAKSEDIRMEVTAECLVTVLLNKPVDAKYRKMLHFTREYYQDIFSEDKVSAELVLFAVTLFKRIESRRKHLSEEALTTYPFIPFASHYILYLFFSRITQNKPITRANLAQLMACIDDATEFASIYSDVAENFKLLLFGYCREEIAALDALKMSQLMKDEKFEMTVTGGVL